MAKKPFEIERELAAAKAEWHETAGKETEAEREARSAAIRKLGDDLSALYSKGAIERPEGTKPMGMKVRPGVYEVGNGEIRSRGETPDEAVQNWNDGMHYFSDGPGVTKGKAAE
jgi:hypothetical protein